MPVGVEAVTRWVEAFARAVAERKRELTRLDSAIGDGDHGTNMDRGMQAVVVKLEQDGGGDDIGRLLKSVGMTLVSKVGGAGGPLYGTLFMQMGSALSGKSALQVSDLAAALDAGVKGVQARGKAEPGDKTMVDALLPALTALREAEREGAALGDALRRSAAAAEEGMRATIPLEARKGRASYLGPRSIGHQDPGATSTHLLLSAAAATLGG
jgi:phosphoenolpyruvate---glycerone phosphotransferase subunit DhaL